MKKYKYLIVGGGMTAAAAVKGIREVDENGSLALFSRETNPPYDRPPLSKALWKDGKVEDIWREVDQWSVDLYLNRPIAKLNPSEKYVQDQDGNRYQFEQCLLATGGNPRHLPFGQGQVLYYRTFADYQQLRKKVEAGGKFVVIGGGFIGAEIAAALCMNEQQVAIVFPESGIGGNRFPTELSRFLNDVYRQKGVEVLNGALVEELSTQKNGKQTLLLDSGKEVEADHIVAGLGITPDTILAEQAGLVVENGIIVDDYLRTSTPDILAAGDVAAFMAPGLNERIRVEHADNANSMGRIAGNNMAGKAIPYQYLPMFYSDLFEYGYEAVGSLDARLKTYANWQDPYQRGVILYLANNRVRGVLLWNVWGKLEAARDLIQSGKSYSETELKNKTEALLAK